MDFESCITDIFRLISDYKSNSLSAESKTFIDNIVSKIDDNVSSDELVKQECDNLKAAIKEIDSF